MTLRVLIAVTHLLGAGHLTRAAAIGRALARRGHEVAVVSGGMPNPLVSTVGCRLVQLAPVRTGVDDFTTLRDEHGRPVDADHLAGRRELLLDTLRTTRPDVVLTELYPFGRRVLAAEFEALTEAALAGLPRPLLLCSARDILVAPGKPAKVAATHAVLHSYDAVLVHGEEALCPLEASWPVDAATRSKLIYTGYIGPDADQPASHDARIEPGRTILVSGGSSAASLPLYRTALAAARADRGTDWHLLIGSGVAQTDYEALHRNLPPHVVLERTRADFRELMSKAAVFVGQAGYNTVMDIVATHARAVLVPFEEGRETEQRMRAETLAARGWVSMLPESRLDPLALADAIRTARALPRPDTALIALDGAETTARAVERLSEARGPQRRRRVQVG